MVARYQEDFDSDTQEAQFSKPNSPTRNTSSKISNDVAQVISPTGILLTNLVIVQ
jgi:hypothetical protein